MFDVSSERFSNNTMTTNDSTNAHASNGTHISSGDIYIEFYALLITASVLFTVGLLGLSLNAALLVATRCKKSIRSLQYGIYYCVAIVNLVLCAIWLPLHTIQMLFNYYKTPVHTVLCYFNVIFYNLSLGALMFLIFFIGIRHLYTLSAQPMHSMRYMTTKGLAITWTVAIIAAVTSGIEYPFNIDHSICTRGFHNNTEVTSLWYSIHAIIVSVIYISTLFVAIVILWIALTAVKHKMAEMLTPQKYTEDVSCMPSTGFDLSGVHDISHEEPSQSTPTPYPSSNYDNSDDKKPASPGCESHEEDDDVIDEDFDLKMRQKIQKQSSGRRHTVANIGLGDSFLGFGRRRGSLEEKPQKTPNNYNYVRKWSVDITALQNQLENPKLFGGSSPVGLADKKDSIPEEMSSSAIKPSCIKKKEEITSSIKNKIVDNLKEVNEEEEIKEEEEEIQENEEKEQNKNSIVEEEEEEEEEEEPTVHDPLATEVPEIVVNGNSPKPGFCGGVRADDECSEELTLQRLQYQIEKTKICIILVFSSLLVCLPYFVLQLIQTLMDIHINRNLSAAAASLCLLQAVLQPLLLARMDDKLMGALRKLHVKLTHWKCVCYCNLGKGKQCFGPSSEAEGATCA